MGGLRLAGLVLLATVAVPLTAFAQASITGTVTDTSGAILPGVTVEATSDALIEKVRSAITDGSGQYRIVDLRPGTYAVNFSLPGFSSVRREGVELTGSFTATINGELRVGALEETVTVTGETPVVDVQSVRRQTTVSNDLLTTIPTARSWAATAVLIPAIATQSGSTADVQVTPQMTVFGGAGGRPNEGRMQVDGLNTGAALNGGGVSTYVADISNAAEVVLTTSGGLGEAEVGGPTISIVPKTGGNTIHGSGYISGVPEGWVGSNYSEALRARGLSTPGTLVKQWDFTGGVGGPIKKDRLWYYVTYRDEGQYRSIPGIYPNLNAGDATKWLYAPDLTRQAQGAESWQIATGRFTLQASARNKFNFYWDEQLPCNGTAYTSTTDGCRQQPESGAFIGNLGLGGLTTITSPETARYLHSPQRVQQITWTSPLTNRVLLEAGFGTFLARFGPVAMPGNPTERLVRVVEQCAGGCAANGNIAGLTYRSADWANNWNGTHTWRASAAYVTGAHSTKFGLVGGFLLNDGKSFTNDRNLTFRVSNGVPNLITQTAAPFQLSNRVRYDALYAQEQWTRGQLTLQGALRFDYARSYSPEERIGPSNYLASATVFPRQDGVTGYKDLSVRAGAAYDVFGNGRTAVKVNLGKYLEPASNNNGSYSLSNPLSRIATSVTRAWVDANGNYEPDCDLTNGAAQDLRPSGGDSCGAISDPNFGRPVFSNTLDPAILGGWGIRPNDWQFGASVQQELWPRVSVELGYYRRWFNNFTVTDNRALAVTDLTPFSLTAPADPRLPGGGGYRVSGLYNVRPELFTRAPDNFITNTANYGEQSQVYDGLLLNVSLRPRNGLTFQGGLNTGKTVQDNCEVRAQVPEMTTTATAGFVWPIVSPTNPFCHSDPGFVTRVTGFGSYEIPVLGIQIAGTFRSDQGGVLAANWNASNAVVQPELGRPIAGGLPNLMVNLVAPGEVWGDRVNEIDLRVAKTLRFGGRRTHVGVDIFNLINAAATLTYNQTYVPNGTWLAPTSVLTPRFVKVSAQIDF